VSDGPFASTGECGQLWEPAREGLSTTKILEPEMQKAPSQGQGFQLQLETNI
jgi:hypothetical protein